MKEVLSTIIEYFLDNGKFFAVICILSLMIHTIIEGVSRKIYGMKIIHAVKKHPYCRGVWLLFYIKLIIYVIYVISALAIILNGVDAFFRADAIEHGYYYI